MNQSPSQTTHLFTNRQITAMLLPLMAEQLLITLMGMVNTFMVAHVGSYAISAVSLVDSINILVIQAFYALSTGGTIVCAQYLGQKKTGHAIRSAEQTLFIVTLISLVTAAFCILFDRQILRLIFGTVDEEVFNSDFWLYWRTMFAFENWHSALEMKLYFQRFIHHIAGLPDFSALKFTKYNQYESLILPMKKYLEDAGVEFRFNTEVTNVIFEHKDGKKIATAIECKEKGVEKGIVLTENDLVFVTNGSCTEGTIYGDQNHAPNGDAEVRTSGCWSLWKNIAKQDPSFGHPEKFCSDVAKTNWESATVTTLDDKIIPYITKICKRDPKSGKVVTGGIVSCQDSKWLLSWTINRQGQFKDQDKDKVCVWVYGLFTDVPGDYVKKPMKECTGKEITEEWLYHLGVPVEEIEDLAENSAVCVPTMMPYITAFFMPRTKGDRPDVIPDGCVNFAFLGQFADTPRDTVFTTEYSVRTAMEAVYGLLGVDRGVPEVWGSVYDVRELLDSSVKLMDGKSPLEIQLPGPLNALKKPLLKLVKGNVIEKLLRDHDILKDNM